jgi:septal ring factor EnvC (AmiA/AmiB activator)
MTASTNLIEDWIQMRSTLQQQLKMLESGEMHTGEKISDSTITIDRIRRLIDELNSLLKEFAVADRS